MIGIVDYNAGNIKSVERALEQLQIPYLVSKNPKDLAKVSKVIFPGVGEAKYAMEQLSLSGFDSFLKDWTQANKPLLGICLGSQIIFDYSEEGDVKCLGLIPGKIKHFSSLLPNTEQHIKIPHMGWNSVEFTSNQNEQEQNIFSHIPQNSDFYFVHSYVIQPEDSSVITGIAQYGIQVPASIHYNSIYAMQFHPEKSGLCGLQILKNFAKMQDRIC
ncbi:MAG: imidazole glycerol phosphate synthase subunit HisH [Spirochaetaceae bacterium]|nr:imidazole glycerol phosphate synthase subunit HisH [Spirochaetaceae bacterium]